MKKVFSVFSLALMGFSTVAMAEEPEGKVSLEYGADVVSSYIWRGQECGGFSVQPSATLTWNKTGLSLGAWASAELFEGNDWANMTEFDLSLAWSKGDFSVALTDYNFCSSYFADWNFSAYSSHTFEASLGYDFGPVALSWNTVLMGADHADDGDRCYSTYVEASAPWKIGEVEGSAAIGASLWDDAFTAVGNDKINVCNISLTASKEFKGIPFMAQIVANPQTDKVYFVVGVTF